MKVIPLILLRPFIIFNIASTLLIKARRLAKVSFASVPFASMDRQEMLARIVFIRDSQLEMRVLAGKQGAKTKPCPLSVGLTGSSGGGRRGCGVLGGEGDGEDRQHIIPIFWQLKLKGTEGPA
jgi:hypothetical protein